MRKIFQSSNNTSIILPYEMPESKSIFKYFFSFDFFYVLFQILVILFLHHKTEQMFLMKKLYQMQFQPKMVQPSYYRL